MEDTPLEWLTFRDSFSASVAIDKNLQLGDVEKMNYLNGTLAGGAARGLPLTKENHNKAVDLLKERFGKTQVLINAHMESLTKINAPSNETKNQRTFYDSLPGREYKERI